MKEVFRLYMNDDIELSLWQKIGVLCLVIVISGCFGWVYEFIFYYFDGGMKTFYMQGGNFLPWINIYAIGAIMVLILTKKCKKNPLLIFGIAFLSTGILEYLSGYVIYQFFGLRFWDYNVEILNFGNIDGFVCLRSVSFFGVSSLFLVYVIVPFCIYLSKIINKRLFLVFSISLCTIIMFDEFYNLVFARVFMLPRASDVYKSMGIKYVSHK